MAVRKRQKRKSKVDSPLRRKLQSYDLSIIYTIDDGAYVGTTRMIADGGIFTSEDSGSYMWITSTRPQLDWISSYTHSEI